MPLYTKIGDKGETLLYGGGMTSKTNPRVHAYGSIDELSALLGVILAEGESGSWREELLSIQRSLYRAGADLATPLRDPVIHMRMTQADVEDMERRIDVLESLIKPLTHFILPGGTRIGALLHQARTVCRRAERWVVSLSESEEINGACLRYLNRLGDFFFALARKVNADADIPETELSSS
jgi:cob(I)alamin adenosyltransferase